MRTRQGISSDIMLARDVPDVLGELGNVCQMEGRPGSREPAQGMAERLVVDEDEELPTLQHEAEVANRGVDGQQLLSKAL